MKKSNLIKVVSILLISLMVMLFTTTVNAAENVDLYNDLSLSNTNSSNTNTNTANTNTNTNSNSNTNSKTNTNSNRNTNTNNSSIYNNTSLPNTGIGDVVPVAALIIVFGISAVYAYRKIKEYKNI